MKRNMIRYTPVVIAFIALTSCGDSGKDSSETAADSTISTSTMEAAKDVVMYNIPSPIETFTILKMAGSGFDKSLTNPTANASKYVSNFSKAVNLGVYSTDLSICFMYKQNQDFNNYLKNVNDLTTALGIDGSYGQSVTKRMMDNSNNMDSLMAIVSEASVNADLYLKENQRSNTTALIAAGGWIEAMHIICAMSAKKENSIINGLIADQKIPARNLVKMLDQFESDAEISALSKDIKEISALYNNVQPVQGKEMASEDKSIQSVGNNSSAELTKEQILAIQTKVDALRNKLTN
jgi:hypothetical protein